jgi:hypothetical protein
MLCEKRSGSFMVHQPDIWTHRVRRVLYARLVQIFGPLSSWEKRNSPGKNLDDEFSKFCDVFAQAVGAKSGDAVKHQIRLAMPETERGSSWGRQAQTAILNKAAALEAGFIEDKHLPDLLAVGRVSKAPAT